MYWEGGPPTVRFAPVVPWPKTGPACGDEVSCEQRRKTRRYLQKTSSTVRLMRHSAAVRDLNDVNVSKMAVCPSVTIPAVVVPCMH
jgi:hypothetical protein